MIRQIAPQFFTTDIPDTVAYYKDKLGFECLGTWQDPPVYAIVARDQHIDFSHYRPTTLARRIERRRVIAGCNTLQAYMELLAESDKERAALRP